MGCCNKVPLKSCDVGRLYREYVKTTMVVIQKTSDGNPDCHALEGSRHQDVQHIQKEGRILSMRLHVAPVAIHGISCPARAIKSFTFGNFGC